MKTLNNKRKKRRAKLDNRAPPRQLDFPTPGDRTEGFEHFRDKVGFLSPTCVARGKQLPSHLV